MLSQSCKHLKISVLLFGLFHLGCLQTQASIGQNFCANNATQPDDNLSCPNAPIGGVQCLRRMQLCDGVNDCGDGTVGSDEGDSEVFSALRCKHMCMKTGTSLMWNG